MLRQFVAICLAKYFLVKHCWRRAFPDAKNLPAFL
jgi:hypothetical protein